MQHSTLFLDESGKSSLAELADQPFILTGVIVDDEDINTVEGFFNYIKLKHGIDPNHPFHSFHLFEKPATKLPDAKAKLVIETCADFISLIPVRVKIVSIDKALFKSSLGIRSPADLKGSPERKAMKEFPYKIMSAKIFTWFADYLVTNNKSGEIVVDARVGGDQHLLHSLNSCKDPLGPLLRSESTKIKERCNAICFAEKNFLSGGLEITDLISYAAYFHVRRMMPSMKHISLPDIWKMTKEKLYNRQLEALNKTQIKKFFSVGRDGVHKYLKSS